MTIEIWYCFMISLVYPDKNNRTKSLIKIDIQWYTHFSFSILSFGFQPVFICSDCVSFCSLLYMYGSIAPTFLNIVSIFPINTMIPLWCPIVLYCCFKMKHPGICVNYWHLRKPLDQGWDQKPVQHMTTMYQCVNKKRDDLLFKDPDCGMRYPFL